MPQDIVSRIDCFSLIFPKDDPRSADAYTRMMRPVFDFEIPKSARKTRFSCAVDVYRLPDVTVSQTMGSASRFTRTLPPDRLNGRYFAIDHPLVKAEIKPESNTLPPFEIAN